MLYKIYDKIKRFIIDNYLVLLIYLILVTTLTYPLPYYIYTSGGIIDVGDKIVVDGGSKSSGSYNMCYVEQLQATIPTYLLSFVHNDWDVVSSKELAFDESETKNDIALRDKIYLETSNYSSLINAFRTANLEYKVLTSNPVIISVLTNIGGDTDLKIGDEILKINDEIINSKDDITKIINSKDIGEIINLKVTNQNKVYDRYAKVIQYENGKMIGISLEFIKKLETIPKVSFNFSDSESGPSAGLMLSLAIYDSLIDEDLTKGLKIAGTGTIDDDGNIGSIGGVRYKLKGAVKNKADIFFIPNGENYEEAIRIQKKHNYKIKIVGVSKFEEAIEYLKRVE